MRHTYLTVGEDILDSPVVALHSELLIAYASRRVEDVT